MMRVLVVDPNCTRPMAETTRAAPRGVSPGTEILALVRPPDAR